MLRFSLTILITISAANAATYNVTLFGADPSGRRPSTEAINLAIDKAAANNGGVVHLPVGSYSTGPINLKTGVVLEVPKGCIVTFLPNRKLYPPITVKLRDGKTRHLPFTPLIRAMGQKNVGIKGAGILEGNGKIWWGRLPPPAKRPIFFHAYDSHNIVLDKVTIRNSPMYNVHICDSTGITITGITINNPPDYKGRGANTDGINCSSCRQLHISGAKIHTGDDCIALDAAGRKAKRIATTDVLIEKCHMTAGHAGVSIGSVTTGGLYNITVKNSIFENTKRGLFIKTNRLRGGLIKNIHYRSIKMKNVKKQAIAIAMVYRAKHQRYHYKNITRKPIVDTTPFIHGIEYDDVTGTCGNEPVLLVGVPESPVRDVHMTKFKVRSLKKEGNYLYHTEQIYINGKRQ